MKGNYSYFYLSMLLGTGFIAGMFYSFEFGFFTYRFIFAGFLTIFPVLLYHLYLKEREKE